MKAVQIFISYAEEDEKLLKRLETHLMPLKRQKVIDIWHARNINAGEDWKNAISDHLNTAQIILLLVSPDFMASDYLNSVEVERAMERHERDDARVIPILLRSSYWDYEGYYKLRASPVKEKLKAEPVISSSWHNQDEAFVEVVKDIHKAAQELIHPYNILFYNNLDGSVKFYSIDDEGNKSLPKEARWQKNWTHIIPGNFTGSKQTNLFLYSSKTGDASFLTIKKSGEVEEIKLHVGWHKGWKEVVPGKFTDSGYTDLLFYSRSEEVVEIYSTDSQGNLLSPRRYPNWSNSWTHITPGDFILNKYTDLLFYNKVNGDAEFYKINNKGVLQSIKSPSSWYKNGTAIVPGNFVENSDYTDLFIYYASTHKAQFLKTNGKGEVTPVRPEPGTGWHAGWKHIVPNRFLQSDYEGLLFHNPSRGLLKIRTTNGRGEFNKGYREHKDGPEHSTYVVYLPSV